MVKPKQLKDDFSPDQLKALRDELGYGYVAQVQAELKKTKKKDYSESHIRAGLNTNPSNNVILAAIAIRDRNRALKRD